MADKSIELFFSYAHEDEPFKDELLKHLRILQRQGVISTWHDRMIPPGSDWDEEIKHYLNTADIILLLVSPDFLDSDYSWGVEVKKAMQRHEAGEACVIPVILRVCNWKKAPFAKLQALPKNAEPITKWVDRDEAFDNVAQEIELAIGQLLEKRKQYVPHPSAQNLQVSLERSFSELSSSTSIPEKKSPNGSMSAYLEILVPQIKREELEEQQRNLQAELDSKVETVRTLEMRRAMKVNPVDRLYLKRKLDSELKEIKRLRKLLSDLKIQLSQIDET